MARQPKLPTPAEFNREWSRLEREDKRRVRRTVNRMQAASTRRDARLAVVFAQNQQRTAKWLLPVSVVLVAALQLPQGLEAVVAMGAISLVLFGAITFAITWRARRAERTNLAVLEGSQALRRDDKGSGEDKRSADPDDPDDAGDTHASGRSGGGSSARGSGKRRKRAHTDGRPRQGKKTAKKRAKARSKR